MPTAHLITNQEALSRVGMKWLPSEDAKLVKEIQDKKNI